MDIRHPRGAGDTKLETLVRREQAHAIFRNQHVALPINCLLAVSISLILYGELAPALVLGWLAAVHAVNLGRYGIARAFLRDTAGESDPQRALDLCTAGSLASAVVWCVVPVLFLDLADSRATALLVVLCGITAGATIQGASHAPATIAFVLPILGITGIMVGAVGSLSGSILAFDIALYTAFLLKGGLVSHAAFRRAFLLQHEAAALARSLQIERDASIAANDRLYRLANLDTLTGLLNRAAFTARLEGGLATARAGNAPLTLALVDLDDFKSVNDTLGHRVGDDVLREVAARLTAAVGPGTAVARLGGDEFAVLLEGIGGERVCDVAERLIAGTNRSFLGSGVPVEIGISLGTATFPNDTQDGDDLLVCADLALYAAKDGGKGRYKIFDAALRQNAQVARDIENDLPQALAGGSLEIWYQPQIALADGALVGLECLIRWCHPRHGWVDPPLVVAAALRTRTSEALTSFVLAKACTAIRELSGGDHARVSVAVTISAKELDRSALPEIVSRTIDAYGVDPRRLELDIAEDAFVASPAAIEKLVRISDSGVRLAIDDFGAGCSSIAHFRKMPIHRIKLDRGFVTGFLDRPDDALLVRTIIGIGKCLGIAVVADGVERLEEAALLRQLGCDVGQGFLYAPAMPLEAVQVWAQMRRNERLPLARAVFEQHGPPERLRVA